MRRQTGKEKYQIIRHVKTLFFADLYEIVYQEDIALLFQFRKEFIHCEQFQKTLLNSKKTYNSFQHANMLKILVWKSNSIITEYATPLFLSERQEYKKYKRMEK